MTQHDSWLDIKIDPPSEEWQSRNPDWRDIEPNDPRWNPDPSDQNGDLGGRLKRQGRNGSDGNGAAEHLSEPEQPGDAHQEVAGDKADAHDNWTFLTPEDCANYEPPDCIIDGLVGPGDMVIVVGKPGAGKSAFLPYLSHRLATGELVCGKPTAQTRVLYISAEDPEGMRARFRALHERFGPAPDLILVPMPVDLMTPGSKDAERLIFHIKRLKVGAVIIDTLTKAFPGIKDNQGDDEGMARPNKLHAAIKAATGAAVFYAHHAPHDDLRSRGHSSFPANADLTMLMDGEGDGLRTITFGKNRRGSSAQTLSFGVDSVVIGESKHGTDVTTVVLREVDQADAAGRTRTNRKMSSLSAQTRRALDLLRDVSIVQGREPPYDSHIPRDVRVVSIHAWRESFMKGTVAAKSETPEKASDAKRQAFKRACDSLIDKKMIGVWGDLAWLAERVHSASGEGKP